MWILPCILDIRGCNMCTSISGWGPLKHPATGCKILIQTYPMFLVGSSCMLASRFTVSSFLTIELKLLMLSVVVVFLYTPPPLPPPPGIHEVLTSLHFKKVVACLLITVVVRIKACVSIYEKIVITVKMIRSKLHVQKVSDFFSVI